MTAEPGWFPDPSGDPETFRWWDGAAWTRWLSRDAGIPAPLVGAGSATPADGSAPATPAEERVGLPAAVVITLAVVVVALVVVGATVVLTSSSVASGPAVAPPSGTREVVVTYDSRSGRVTVGELSYVQPDDPYECSESPHPILPAFASEIGCDALIHEDYAAGKSSYANTGLGTVPDDLVVDGDLERTGKNVFAALRGLGYSFPTTLERSRTQTTPWGPADTVLLISAEVHYDQKGLPSSYDRMIVLIVELDDGGYAALFSIRPDDVRPATLEVLNDSLDTITVD